MFNNSKVGLKSGRKGKEVADGVAAPISSFNLFSQQSQNPSSNLVSTTLGLGMTDQNQQSFQSLLMPYVSVSSFMSKDLSTQMKQQSEEIDQIIKNRVDEMRRIVAEKCHKHYSALLCAVEQEVQQQFRLKELEIERAVRKNLDLEEKVAQLKVQVLVSQAKLRTLEETTTSLRAALDRKTVRHRERSVGNRRAQAEDVESSFVDPQRVEPVVLACKTCQSHAATVMIWPCKHMSVCTRCEPTVKACPICYTLKTTSIEVYLS